MLRFAGKAWKPALIVVSAAVLFSASEPGSARAQQPMDPPEVPPPLPPTTREKGEEKPTYPESIVPESDRPWGLDDELLERLAERARVYRDYAVRFSCEETARLAEYSGSGEANSEKVRRYAYLLVRDGDRIEEFRNRLTREGRPRREPVKDEEPFPPAYSWVFLFSDFNQPYFSFRDLGDRFEGFDWVREIQFRGAIAFDDGKDIRQWEGTVLVDAVTFTPLEIRAQPSRQDERILVQFDRWARSFNLIGFRLAPKPLVYRSHVQFRYRRDGLTFPTRLRYDTRRAVSKKRSVSIRASTRVYDGYRFFEPKIEDEEFEASPETEGPPVGAVPRE